MPRYEFLCQKCKKPFELVMTISDPGIWRDDPSAVATSIPLEL